jgi:hypothetical protein
MATPTTPKSSIISDGSLTDAQKKAQEKERANRDQVRQYFMQKRFQEMGGWHWERILGLPTDTTLQGNHEERKMWESLATLDGAYHLGELKPGIYAHMDQSVTKHKIRVNENGSIVPHGPPEMYAWNRKGHFREAYGAVMDFLVARRGCRSFTLGFNGAPPEWIADHLKNKLFVLLGEAEKRGVTVKLNEDVIAALSIMEVKYPKKAKRLHERLIDLETNQLKDVNLYNVEKTLLYGEIKGKINEKKEKVKQAVDALSTALVAHPPSKEGIQQAQEAFEKAAQELGQVLHEAKEEIKKLSIISEPVRRVTKELIDQYKELVDEARIGWEDAYQSVRKNIGLVEGDKEEYKAIKGSIESTGSLAKIAEQTEQAFTEVTQAAEAKRIEIKQTPLPPQEEQKGGVRRP